MTTTVEALSVSPFTGDVTVSTKVATIRPGETHLYKEIYSSFPINTTTEDITVTNVDDDKTVVKTQRGKVVLNGDNQSIDVCTKSELPIGTTGYRITNTLSHTKTAC